MEVWVESQRVVSTSEDGKTITVVVEVKRAPAG
jgi:hypothetical protein